MFTLILDTSSDASFIAIASESNILLESHFHGRSASQKLAPQVDHFFKKLGISISDIKAIGVGIGPGSFTGIRVASAFALGLSPFGKPPLIAFNSFTGLIGEEEARFASLIFPKVGGAFVSFREKNSTGIRDLCDPAFIPYDKFDSEIKDIAYGVASHIPPTHFSFPLIVRPPHLGYIAKIIESKYASSNFSEKLDLLYLRQCQYSTLSS